MGQYRSLLQESGRVHQNIGLVMLERAVLINGHFPFSALIIPLRLFDAGVELDTLIQTPFLHGSLDVLFDLGARSVEVRPVRVGFEEEGVAV